MSNDIDTRNAYGIYRRDSLSGFEVRPRVIRNICATCATCAICATYNSHTAYHTCENSEIAASMSRTHDCG